MIVSANNRFVGILDSTDKEWKLESNNAMPVNIHDQHTDSVDLYAHIMKVTPSITVNTNLYDESITVDSISGIGVGDVIIIFEDIKFYQSLVTSAGALTIGLVSPLDFAFTTDAIVHVGTRNLAVNGSITPQIAHIIPPPSAAIDIYQINVSITDNAEMDSAKFGSISVLTNGILFRVLNGTVKNLPLIVNNIGFSEYGFDIQYDDKAPAGVYGFNAKKNYREVNGISIRLDGNTGDEFQCIIRDNLTDLTMMNIMINGHIVTDGCR